MGHYPILSSYIITGDTNGGGSQDLQSVTDNGATTTNAIIVNDGPAETTTVSGVSVKSEDTIANTFAQLNSFGSLALKNGNVISQLKNINVTNTDVILEFPNKATGSYTIATTSDLTAGSNINISGSNGNFTISVTGITDGSTFTGGTISGSTTFTNGLTANTFSAGTYQNLPISGLTAGNNINISGSNGNFTISVTGITGGSTFTGGTVSGLTIFNSGLTANTIYTDYIDFNQNYTGTTTTGRISWDKGTGTLNIGVGDSGTTIDLQVGQEEIVRVFNSESTALLEGEIVYVSGSQGNRPRVKRAIATSDGYSVTTLGMVSKDIDPGAEGYVTTFGIISNLNTLGLTGGTPIWLSPTTPGGYTSIKPQAPFHTVLIGYVLRIDNNVGSVFVNISNGWELDELHDVRISAATEGDLLVRSSFNGSPIWVNTKTLTGSGYTINGNLTVTGNTSLQSFTGTTGIINGDLTVTGNTSLQGLTANTISATTISGGTFFGNGSNLTGINSYSYPIYKTGNTITFDSQYFYNSRTTPGTGNITENLIGAQLGVVQKIYHNDSILPSFPSGWILIGSGTYVISSLNIIMCEWIGGTSTEYWILQDQ
jgi:hypothetical protein